MAEIDLEQYITPTWLREGVLAGINFTGDDGAALSDSLFSRSIRAAITAAERAFDIRIRPFSPDFEKHDLYRLNETSWWQVRLDQSPLRQITKFAVQLGNQERLEYPSNWISVTSRLYSTLNLIPTAESLGGYSAAFAHGTGIHAMLHASDYIPGYFQFSYEAGFYCAEEQLTILEGETSAVLEFPFELPTRPTFEATLTTANGATGLRVSRVSNKSITVSVQTAPAGGAAVVDLTILGVGEDLLHWISIMAGLTPLAVAGDLVLGAGISSQTISMDGLSQSIQSTASAMYHAYSARVNGLLQEGARLEAGLKATFKHPNVGSL